MRTARGESDAGRAGGPALLVAAAVLFAATVLALIAAIAPVPRAEALIYWTSGESSPGAGMVGRANLNGNRSEADFITGASSPAGLEVSSSHVFWTNAGTADIGRARIDGGAPNPGFLDGGNPGDRLWGLALAGPRLYWTAIGPYRVRRGNLNGGAQLNFLETPQAPIDVAVRGKRIYWINNYNSIGRANVDGSGVNQSFIPLNSTEAAGIYVAGGRIYWTTRGFPHGDGTIARANVDGSGVENDFITGLNDPAGVTVSSSHVYWTNYDGRTIGRARLDGGAVNDEFIELDTRAYGIATDWALNRGSNFRIGKASRNRANGTARLAVEVPGPGRLVLRGTGLRTTRKVAEKRRILLPVRPRAGVKQSLAVNGQARVIARVIFRPRLGEGGRLKSKRIRLLKD